MGAEPLTSMQCLRQYNFARETSHCCSRSLFVISMMQASELDAVIAPKEGQPTLKL